MTRARDVSRLITTPPSIYQTDTESSSAGYLSQSSASSTYQTIAGNNNSYRNKIINGDFNIWQRGTSFTEATLSQGAAASYCADRWYGFRPPDGAGFSISRQPSGLTGFEYCARVQRPNTNGKSDRCVFAQSIETANFIPIAGQTVTLSFYARIGANFSATSNALNVNIITGTGTDQSAYDISTFPSNGNYSGPATVLNQTFNLTTSWTRYTATFSTASNATESTIRFSFQPTGTAGANDWFEITGVQLELGSVATPYESISIADELAQCLRYFEWVGYYTTNWNTATTTARTGVNWLVKKRRSPDVTFTSGYNQYGPGGQLSITSISSVQSGTDGALFTFSQSGGLTTNAPSTANIALKVDGEL